MRDRQATAIYKKYVLEVLPEAIHLLKKGWMCTGVNQGKDVLPRKSRDP